MNRRRLGTLVVAAWLGPLLCTAAATPAQADTPTSWEARALGLSSAQRTTKGDGVKVAVLDSGVEKDHPALAGKVTTGPDFLKDGLRPGDPRWGGHGTAMASDVLKVAPKADILSVRVIDDKKEHDPDDWKTGPSPVAQGIEYAVDHGADVISMSLGGDSFGSSFNEEETKALAHAAYKGVTVVASAGNDGDVLNDSSYPAGYRVSSPSPPCNRAAAAPSSPPCGRTTPWRRPASASSARRTPAATHPSTAPRPRRPSPPVWSR